MKIKIFKYVEVFSKYKHTLLKSIKELIDYIGTYAFLIYFLILN